MAHVEPMDIDGIAGDYEDKENSIHHSNLLPKIPCTEKGYEELDVSELSMKLRYSITPASSPMSRSYTANCKDNKNVEDANSGLNIGNVDLTSSLNSTLTNSDINKASKVYPFQALPTDNLNDMNRNVLIPKCLDTEDNNITITVSDNIDETFSIPSTSSSMPHTPEAITPTKELPKDGGSPIMRGLRSVLSMFKAQSSQPSHEQSSQDPLQINNTILEETESQYVEVSTPFRTTNRNSPKRTSPFKDRIVFNDDLEKELQWKNDSTIFFKEDKIPKHKLYLQESVASNLESNILNKTKEECNQTLEYMDISYNDTFVNDKTMTDMETKPHAVLEGVCLESDGEFVDCETTYTENESLLNIKENVSLQNCKQHISRNLEVNILDSTVDFGTSNSSLAIECADLPPCTSNDVSNTGILTKDISENGNLGSDNCLEDTFSLIHSNERSLCETELQVNSDMNVCETMANNYSASNIEVNKIDIMKISSDHNATDSFQCKEEEIEDKLLICHKTDTDLNLFSIENEIECKESCIDDFSDHKILTLIKGDDVKIKAVEVNNHTRTDTVQFNVIKEGSKSKQAVYINTSDNNPNLSKIDNQITCNTINEKTTEFLNSEAFDINMKSTISEESNKEMEKDKNSLPQTNNETLENNLSDIEPVNICREISTQNNNVGIDEYAKSPHEINHIILSNLEVNKKLPNNIPLPTDDFDKEIDTVSEANKIPGATETEIMKRELVQNLNINVNEGLENVSYAIKIVEKKTVDQISDLINCEPKSSENAEKCENYIMTCNKTSEKNISFENIKTNEVVNKLVFPEDEKELSNHEIINYLVDDVIEEIPKTLDSDSLQPVNASEAIKVNDDKISKNNISIQCDTNSNIERLDEEVCSNMEQLSNPFETINKLQISPPLSPLMNKRGYNIDFDNIEDPFATKTKIRESPTPDITGQVSLAKEDPKSQKVSSKINKSNKIKSYPIKKPMNTKKNSINATFDFSIKNDCKENKDLTVVNTKKDTFDSTFKADSMGLINTVYKSVNKLDNETENETICINDNKKMTIENKHIPHISSEPTNPSPPRDVTKSVFNCPEINDINFCSFSDKQKTLSPDLMIASEDITIDNEEYLNPKIDLLEPISPEAINDQQLMLKVVNETSVSKESKNSDVKEVNTEDEDTVTFDETTEFIESDKENGSSVKDRLAFDVADTVLDNDIADNDEMFIDAEAFEFLLNQNKSNVIADSGKESLFLKFDPLFTKRVSSDGIIAALKRVQNNQSTPKKLTKLQLEAASEMPGPSQKETLDDEASMQALSKPMMVVNPAINSIVSPKKVATPKVNRQSVTFTSPAMAVIDKLLSLSGNSLINDHITPVSSPIRQHNETDVAITQLREMLADKDIHVHNLKSESKELKDRLCSLEEQVTSLEVESAERLKKVNDLNERLLEKIKMNKSMANVVEEYERTIASLIAQIEQEKKNNAEEKIILIKERDEQTAHLASMEVSFNDLHSKYEKSKQLIYCMKANEETYKKSIKEFEESLSKMQNNYELLKQHATSKLNHANLELGKFNRAHEAEVLKLNAMIKRKELHISSLEETLAQKTKANEELTSICDELINKVG